MSARDAWWRTLQRGETLRLETRRHSVAIMPRGREWEICPGVTRPGYGRRVDSRDLDAELRLWAERGATVRQPAPELRAGCGQCGWLGPARTRHRDADRDAGAHTKRSRHRGVHVEQRQ